ncbi:hypothetical protein ACIQU5_00370 [Streptomyces sp. NPDC090306]|uniref:hypothetical protein n=1 Tax=unclassified Streptomyces TaxID=2593676 RepID=UPI0036F11B1B
MGDFFQRIVDVEVGAREAGPLAVRAVDWLVGEGVITREISGDGVYSPTANEGYLPGPAWRTAAAGSPDPSWLPGPVAVMTGRNYYVGGQGEDTASSATCARCGIKQVIINYPARFEPDEGAWRPFREAIAQWRATGEGTVVCPSCRTPISVLEWTFDSDFVLGALAFDFWGWPPLAIGFLARLQRQLGHRTADHSGKF